MTFGKISCAAKGARRPNSRLLAGSQALCFGEYVLYRGQGGTYHMNSCEPIEVFYNVRTDLDKLQYVAHILKIVEDITNEADLIIAIFKLRLMSIIGFTPNVTECVNCNSKENLTHFSIKNSGLKCKACAKQDKSVISISDATLYAIKYIIMAPAKKLFSFNIPEDSIEELKLISKVYMEDKLEKSYKFEKIIF